MALNTAPLVGILASRIDFRVEGRRPLEQFFREFGGYAVLENPSTSAETISSILGVGTKRTLAIEPLEQMLRTFVFNDEQKEHLFAREKRVKAWTAYLEYQSVTDEELTRILGLGLGSAIALSVFAHQIRFNLKARADLTEILELCGRYPQLMWLAQSETGEFMEQAARWITPKSHWDYHDEQKDTLKLLIERRGDLIESFLEVDDTSVRNALGGSRHVTDLSQQMKLAGLNEAPATFSDVEYNAWIEKYGYSLNSLVWNPVCHLEVIEAVKSHLEDGAGEFVLARRIEPALGVHSGTERRLRTWAEKHHFEESYEEVSDPDIIDWLYSRCMRPHGSEESTRPYDAAALLKNKNLPLNLRRALESNRTDSVLAVEHLRRDYVVKSAADVQAKSGLRCVGACSGSTRCGLPYCSLSTYGDIGAQKLGPLVNRASGGPTSFTDWAQSSPLDEWLVKRLGNEPTVYRAFIGLATEWELSVEELCETAEMLAGAD